ncbi:hypothetical protein ACFQ9X_39640 [Catenulispora yoronensis]
MRTDLLGRARAPDILHDPAQACGPWIQKSPQHQGQHRRRLAIAPRIDHEHRIRDHRTHRTPGRRHQLPHRPEPMCCDPRRIPADGHQALADRHVAADPSGRHLQHQARDRVREQQRIGAEDAQGRLKAGEPQGDGRKRPGRPELREQQQDGDGVRLRIRQDPGGGERMGVRVR